MALRMLVAMLLVAGCFDPRVENGGYSCAPSDDPACPSGFVCIRGRCLDTTDVVDAGVGAGVADDLASSGGGADLAGHDPAHHDLGVASKDLGPAHDFAVAGADLAVVMDLAMAPPDLAHAPPDLKKGPDLATGMCGHAGTPCTLNSQCCSDTCSPSQGNICIGG